MHSACRAPFAALALTLAAASTAQAANGGAITVSPSHLSIKPGTAVTLSIQTAADGTSQQYSLGVGGLPASVSGTFNPTQIQMGQSTQLTLSADSHAAGGNWNYTVQAINPSTGTAAYSGGASVTVDNGSSGCPAGTTDNNGYCVPNNTGCSSTDLGGRWALLIGVGLFFIVRARRNQRTA
jgi:hypothetical protein